VEKTLALHTPRGALIALGILSLLWGYNWLALKMALAYAGPLSFTVHRTVLGVAALFALLVLQGRSLRPQSWTAVIVIGFFQVTLNFGASIMALVSGGVGRTAVLVFTMPFWTMLMAWPLLGERVRGMQWLAVVLAVAGLTLILQPWNWHDGLVAKLYAVLSGFSWAAAAISAKYFQRHKPFDLMNFTAWHLLIGIIPLAVIAWFMPSRETQWTPAYFVLLFYCGVISTALGWIIWLSVLGRLSAGTASLNALAIPVIALVASTLQFGERLTTLEWVGVALIGGGLAVVTWRALQAHRPVVPEETAESC
jgi:drug/metabolite transporter (DMT)-like permease